MSTWTSPIDNWLELRRNEGERRRLAWLVYQHRVQTGDESWLEVRCCCTPGLLLGMLPMPKGLYAVAFRRVTFLAFDVDRFNRTIEQPLEIDGKPRLIPRRTVSLTIREWQAREWLERRRLAFASDEYPLSTFRAIPEFLEINEVHS